jgi:pSer/pThr/pTyr-binding forkhead associated (FHA) protein
MDLLLEIVEGPGAGRQIQLSQRAVIGRDAASADIVLDDDQISRRHAAIEPGAGGVVVEDLDSTNGTFVNHNEIHGRAEASPGDELLMGVTLMQLRSREQVAHQASAVVAIPPGLARPESRPAYVERVADAAGVPAPAPSEGIADLQRLRDARVKTRAQVAPLAIFVTAALVVVIYLGLR